VDYTRTKKKEALMNKLIAILLLFATTSCQGQQFQRLSTNLGYETNFDAAIINLGLELGYTVPVFGKGKNIAFGAGVDFWMDSNFLFDTQLSFAIFQRKNFSFYWNDHSLVLFIACHYKFSKEFNEQYISPELALNIWSNRRFCMTPGISYYINLKSEDKSYDKIYFGLKIKYAIFRQ
jgi:hypothetical protein